MNHQIVKDNNASKETHRQITALFDTWNQALGTGDPGKVASLYGPGAILVPTLSNKVRHNQHEISEYFDHFLKKRPIGRIVESNIRLYGDIALNSGTYIFNLDSASGGREDAAARFTFVYRRFDSEWLIIEHHSSLMPG